MFDDDEGDEPVKFSINEKYATSYGRWREKEELQKLKDRYGDVAENEEESSESESDTLEDLDPKTDKTFLSVLSSLKAKDPAIYDKQVTFFPDITENEPQEIDDNRKINVTKSKEKPLYLKDYERKLITEKEGQPVDETDEKIDSEVDFESFTYTEKQRKLKESFNKVSNNLDDDGEDDFLRPRIKTEAEKKKEDDDYLEWLKGRKDTINESEDVKKLKSLHDFWNQPNLDQDEKFLKDFILNKRYKSTDDENQELPTYNDIVGDNDERVDFEEEEKLIEAQEQFEHKYNFRFEEPDEDFVKSYPRTIKDSLRRKDEKNKSKRDAYKERKAKEKEQKTQEIKRLKSLKRKEISEKLAKIREITGELDLPLDPDEFDRDFDPADYDQKMKRMFDDAYYSKTNDNDQKPVFSNSSDDETDEDNIDNMVTLNSSSTDGTVVDVHQKQGQSDTALKKEVAVDTPTGSDNKRKRKKQSAFLDVISKKKPLFDPNEKSVQQYFDEYYKLDYEDIIGGGDTVCRFKYRKVTPNDFGLSVEEILTAKPKELNAWVSVKKMSQYRPETDEVYDVNAYKTKAENFEKKKRLLYSVYHEKSESEDDERNDEIPVPSTSSKTTSASKTPIIKAADQAQASADPETSVSEESAKKRKRKRNKGGSRRAENVNVQESQKPVVKKNKNFRPSTQGGIVNQLSDDRLKAYGMNPKKIRNKIKYTKA